MTAVAAVNAARKALELAWDGRLPVNPAAIASGLLMHNSSGGDHVPIHIEGGDLGSLSGSAEYREGPAGPYYLCLFNSREADYRNRFTMAHELGHVLLQHVTPGRLKKRDTTFNADPYDTEEIAANAFAAALIMPEEHVRSLSQVKPDISSLAAEFGVSPTTIRFRLKNLGLL